MSELDDYSTINSINDLLKEDNNKLMKKSKQRSKIKKYTSDRPQCNGCVKVIKSKIQENYGTEKMFKFYKDNKVIVYKQCKQHCKENEDYCGRHLKSYMKSEEDDDFLFVKISDVESDPLKKKDLSELTPKKTTKIVTKNNIAILINHLIETNNHLICLVKDLKKDVNRLSKSKGLDNFEKKTKHKKKVKQIELDLSDSDDELSTTDEIKTTESDSDNFMNGISDSEEEIDTTKFSDKFGNEYLLNESNMKVYDESGKLVGELYETSNDSYSVKYNDEYYIIKKTLKHKSEEYNRDIVENKVYDVTDDYVGDYDPKKKKLILFE